MKALLATALFLLGVYLGLRVIAAFFRIVDLWYRIGTSWPQVLRGVAGWGGATLLVVLVAGEQYRPPFVWGLLAYAGLALVYPMFVYPALRLSLFLRSRR